MPSTASTAPVATTSARGPMASLERASASLLWILVLARVAIMLIAVVSFERETPTEPTIVRFHELGTSDARPWRDEAIEFPPLQILAIDALTGADVAATASRLVVVWLVADLGAALILGTTWGRRTAAAYLVLGLPLAPFVATSLDVATVALTVGGVALAVRARQRGGGVLLAGAALARLWPALLIVSLAVSGRRRAARWFAVSLGAGVAGWVAWGGVGAPRQVVTFRGATGWEIGRTGVRSYGL